MKTLLISILTVLLGAPGWIPNSVGEEAETPRGEVRIVDKHHFNWAFIALNVFEHLITLDKEGQLVPRLATGWQWLDDRTLEVTLRQEVRFHNGEVFDTEIVKLNWEQNTRLKQPFVPGRFMNFEVGSRLEIVNSQTVRFIFPSVDGGALAKLSLVHMANRQFYKDFGWGEKHW